MLYIKVAICKCAAHITNTDPVSKGNRKADEEEKKAARLPAENLLSKEEAHTGIDHQVLCDMQKAATQTKRQIWQNKGAMQFTMHSRIYMNDLK